MPVDIELLWEGKLRGWVLTTPGRWDVFRPQGKLGLELRGLGTLVVQSLYEYPAYRPSSKGCIRPLN